MAPYKEMYYSLSDSAAQAAALLQQAQKRTEEMFICVDDGEVTIMERKADGCASGSDRQQERGRPP